MPKVPACHPGCVTLSLLAVQHAHTSAGGGTVYGFLLVGLIVFGAGMYFGRRRGLKHLGAVEFRTRWANVRRHRRW